MDNVDLIERTMRERGMDRADLARDTGIHAGLIGRYLAKKVRIGLLNAPRIAKALGLDQAEVLFGRPGEGVAA